MSPCSNFSFAFALKKEWLPFISRVHQLSFASLQRTVHTRRHALEFQILQDLCSSMPSSSPPLNPTSSTDGLLFMRSNVVLFATNVRVFRGDQLVPFFLRKLHSVPSETVLEKLACNLLPLLSIANKRPASGFYSTSVLFFHSLLFVNFASFLSSRSQTGIIIIMASVGWRWKISFILCIYIYFSLFVEKDLLLKQ